MLVVALPGTFYPVQRQLPAVLAVAGTEATALKYQPLVAKILVAVVVVEALHIPLLFWVQTVALASCASGYTKNKRGLRFGGRERRFIWQVYVVPLFVPVVSRS